MKSYGRIQHGFIELYMAVGLFLILAFGMSMAIEYKTRQIKTEKSAWLAQTYSWEKSQNNRRMRRDNPEFIQALQTGYRQKTPLTVTKSRLLDRESDTLVSDGLIRSIATVVNLLKTYRQCPEQVEPLSLLAFKHIFYPHGQSNIKKTFDPTFNQGISTYMDLTTMDQHKAVYEDINRTFTGTDIGETGWFLRQLLWQEAMGKSEFGYFIPLQLLGVFEFSKRITAVLTKSPGLFGLLKRGKIRKAKNLIKKDILGSFLMEQLTQQLEDYLDMTPTSNFDATSCQQL